MPYSILSFSNNTFSRRTSALKNGDYARIRHVETGANLHSHPINYSHPGTSGQQQVTAFLDRDLNDVWVIRDCRSHPVKHGDVFRLQHHLTGMYLHSHPNIPAPLTTSQQEVTGWQGKDSNDMWRVEVEGGGLWLPGKRFRLIHVETRAALHSHRVAGDPIPQNQYEVTAFAERDNNDLWTFSNAEEFPAPPERYPWCVKAVLRPKTGGADEPPRNVTVLAQQDTAAAARLALIEQVKETHVVVIVQGSQKGECP
jgi:dolichyl-phosphate-mannose--protein O-mannosyl transferase